MDLRIGFWPVVHFIRPCSLFPIDNLSIYAQNFFKFCIHIVIGDEWYGIVNGQNPTIFDGVTALSPFKKWFLACFSFTVYDIWMKLHRYVEQQRLHITMKDRHSYLSSSWVICPWLILSIAVLLLFRHYISHKITFGAPSSGGVLCSACGAFILYWNYLFLDLLLHYFWKTVSVNTIFTLCIQTPDFLAWLGQARKILVLITYSQKSPLNTHADISNGVGGLLFGLGFPLLSYFVYVRREGASKTAGMQARLSLFWLSIN